MIEFKEMISILLNPVSTFIMNKFTKVITVVNNEKKPEGSYIAVRDLKEAVEIILK